MKSFLVTIFILLIAGQLSFSQTSNEKDYGDLQKNWNNILKQEWFEHDANKLLIETVKELKPGKALDVAMSEGRNAFYLAQLGWNVTGFDIANEALDSVDAKAKLLNLEIRTVHASKEDFDFGQTKWDLVVLSYVDIICGGCIANDDFIEILGNCTQKNGIVVYEMAHRDWYLENRENPGEWGCTEERLTEAFKENGFEILLCEAVVEKGDWGGDDPGKMIKFVAKRL